MVYKAKIDFSISTLLFVLFDLTSVSNRKGSSMNSDRFVFSQLSDFLPRYEFNKCVARYRGNWRVRTFSCYDQLLAMMFAQLTGQESLRDTAISLGTVRNKLFHAGFRNNDIAKSTLADANENRDWRIYADFAQVLIGHARLLYRNEPFAVELEQPAYVFDSTTVDLCLSLFPWAKFRHRKGAVKLHTLLDLRGNLPCYIQITNGNVHDVNLLDDLVVEPGAFYIMDRGYTDFERLYRLSRQAAFYVIRAKFNLGYSVRDSRTFDRSTGLRNDQTIVLDGYQTSRDYPQPLRRISYIDVETEKRYIYLTNNFSLPALTIAQLYKARWEIELFFKWIKQNLRIKAFYGYSDNAVRTQIWIAVITYVLLAIIKAELKCVLSLGEIIQTLRTPILDKVNIKQLLSNNKKINDGFTSNNQLLLLDF